jgi:cation:H+ antiporter
MSADAHPRLRRRDVLALVVATALPLPWIAAESLGTPFSPIATASLAGAAILGAAALISWGAELAERDIPQALAILFLALISVLPEYAVDLHFAWTAGKDISYAPYAVANMTGANRLLIGLGWTSVVLVGCLRSGAPHIVIDDRQRLELRYLLWATVYSFLIPLDGTIGLLDAAVLLAIFAGYAAEAMRGAAGEEVELVGPPALIERSFGDRGRRIWTIAIFLYCGYAIFVSAEPFADGLVEIGHTHRIDEFLLVQWVAPLASESPEFVIAIVFALRMRSSLGVGALISSKVNQWTLLVGAIPIAFAISSNGLHGLPLDGRQTEELVLTSAQSLLAVVLIADMSFSRLKAVILAALFLCQFAFTSTEVRWAFTFLYLTIAAGVLVVGGTARRTRFYSLFFRSSTRGAAA